MKNLQIEQWKIENITPYENNPRKNDAAVHRMTEAITEFGFRLPLLVLSNGELIDGHLRLKAALSLGLEYVPVIIADDMTEQQVRAFRILVNRSATWADWDTDLLLQEFEILKANNFDLLLTGFDQSELDELLLEMDKSTDLDKVPDVPEVSPIKEGEIWVLGRHRLMCGDSTILANAKKLLKGKSANMIWTDPPYNVDYSGKAGKIKNDKMGRAEFDTFLLSAHEVMFEVLQKGGAIYVAHSEAGDGMAFRRAFIGAGFKLSACLIWRKQAAVLGRSDYHFQHEPILYGWKKGESHKWYGNRKQKSVFDFAFDNIIHLEDGSFELVLGGKVFRLVGENILLEELYTSVIDIPKPAKSDLHPTTKPVALIQRMLANSCPPHGLVFDPFGGSGSTLIACEDLGRTCVTMEIDPCFAEVIIKRFEEFSGIIPYRESDGKQLSEI